MKNEFNLIKEARILATLIHHSDEKGNVKDVDLFFNDVFSFLSNGNQVTSFLYSLSENGVIHYDEIGEEGFKPIVMLSCTSQTNKYLDQILEKIENDQDDLRQRLKEILTFDPENLKTQIERVESQLMVAKKSAEENDLLKPLLQQISTIDAHFQSAARVAKHYEDVYKNIIRPMQIEGQSGIKATVKWAIIGIVASTAISIVLGNLKTLAELFHKFI
ncbi:hypothetical protein ACO0LC_12875 [Undibacterium sp. JH2W]|uniref:hypothetical protein n=1 Tax=Undibacterium sp. JH2W TaxID=3413037 RepID=UPI003BF241B4